MRILMAVHTNLNINAGAAGSTFWLTEEYKSFGHDVTLLSFDDLPQGMSRRMKEIVFPAYAYRRIKALQKHGGLDVAVITSAGAWLSALRPFSRDRSPLIVTRSFMLEHTMHNALVAEAKQGNLKLSWKYPIYHGGYELKVVALGTRAADLATFLHQDDLAYAVEHLGVKPERARIVDNGIPNYLLDLPYDPTPTGEDDELHIVQIGTWIPRKGIAYTVPALNNLMQRYPKLHVTIMGTDNVPIEETLSDFHAELHDRITVIPKFAHADLPKLLAGKHIKLFPTLAEGFGKALIEAMACGLAPVTTSAIPEHLVTDGIDALVVPPRDAGALEKALERLIEDRAFLDRMRAQAHWRAQDFSWREAARRRLELYQEFLDAKHYRTQTRGQESHT